MLVAPLTEDLRQALPSPHCILSPRCALLTPITSELLTLLHSFLFPIQSSGSHTDSQKVRRDEALFPNFSPFWHILPSSQPPKTTTARCSVAQN